MPSSQTDEHLSTDFNPRYNAPEVFTQRCKPIQRVEMKKCDIWAFGLLAWEILLHGRSYTADLSDGCETSPRENPIKYLDPDEVLSSALHAAKFSTRGTDVIQRAISSTFSNEPSTPIRAYG
jgi:hypothetical protein